MRRGIGCLGVLAGLFAIAALVSAAVGYYVYSNAGRWVAQAGEWARVEAAKLLEEIAKDIPRGLDLTDSEKAAARGVVEELAGEVRANKVTLKEAGEISMGLLAGPVSFAMLALALEPKYLKDSGLPDDAKAKGRATSRRWVRGVLERRIGEKEWGELKPLLIEESTGPHGKKKIELKERIPDADLSKILEIMQRQAAAAAVPAEPDAVDLAGAIRASIAAARAKARGEAVPPAGTVAPSPAAASPAASSPRAAVVSPAECYRVAATINRKLAALAGDARATPQDPGAAPRRLHGWRHAYFKGHALLATLHRLRRKVGLRTFGTDELPAGEPGPAEMLAIGQACVDAMDGLERAVPGAIPASAAPAVEGKTPADVYDALSEAELRLDALGAPAVTPSECHRMAVFVQQQLEGVRAARGVRGAVPAAGRASGKTPADNYQQARGLLADLAGVKDPVPAAPLAGNRTGEVLPGHVLELLANAAADAAALNAKARGGAPHRLPALEPGRTPQDVFGQIVRARQLARSLSAK